jgi:hypothetical protein
MPVSKFTRHSINLDERSYVQGGMLAAHLAVSLSGLIRILIRNAFEARQNGYVTQDDSRSCLTTYENGAMD